MLSETDIKKLNNESKINLNLEETLISHNAFKNVVGVIENGIAGIYYVNSESKKRFYSSKIKIRLVEMLEKDI